jgi:plastocyanin
MLNRCICFVCIMGTRTIRTIPVTLILVATLTVSSALTLLMPVRVNLAEAQTSVKEVSAPGVNPNEYYIFTQELNANEAKLGLPVAVFTLTNIIVHKGDNVTIHFYNTADEVSDRHTFSMQSPYKMDHDLAGGQNATFSFKADTVGGFTYYCRYDLPSMIGHLEVLP